MVPFTLERNKSRFLEFGILVFANDETCTSYLFAEWHKALNLVSSSTEESYVITHIIRE